MLMRYDHLSRQRAWFWAWWFRGRRVHPHGPGPFVPKERES